MSYDGLYGDLSTRGTANDILDAVLQSQAEVEQIQDEIEITAGEVAQQAQQGADSAAAALASEVAAGVSAGSASSSAASAALAAGDAAGAAVTANNSQIAAAASEAAAALSETNAANSAASADASEAMAEKWAQNPEDVAVVPGEFSAFHWAQKAEDIVVDITGPRLTSIASAVMAVNDILIANSTTTMTSMSTGAAGRSILDMDAASDVRTFLSINNVNNTSDANKPISTATQTALDGKQPLNGKLTSLSALSMVANDIPISTGGNNFGVVASGTVGRDVLVSATKLAARTATDSMGIGDFGLGTAAPTVITDPNTLRVTSFTGPIGAGAVNFPAGSNINFGPLLTMARNTSGLMQVGSFASPVSELDIRARGSVDTGATWTPWRALYHTGNAVGTVSHASGIPTGAIMERGSNGNGSYIKYADGTMICWHFLSVSSVAVNNAASPFFYSADQTITYPAPFASDTAPLAWGGRAVSDGNIVFSVFRSALLSSFTHRFICNNSSGAIGVTVSYIAIGRWF